jgi:hypothetical protein
MTPGVGLPEQNIMQVKYVNLKYVIFTLEKNVKRDR